MIQILTQLRYKLTTCALLLAILGLNGQTDSLPVIDYSDTKVYEIGGISVVGNNLSDENAIISVAGLKVGRQISVPGVDIRSAIRALWKLKLFTTDLKTISMIIKSPRILFLLEKSSLEMDTP